MSGGTDRVASIAEAVSLISDGDAVGIGGHSARRHPMALVREIARQRRRGLHLVGWSNGIDMDLLTGAGCVAMIETSSVGIDGTGSAHNIRRGVEAGALKVALSTQAIAVGRFRAAAMGSPFLASRIGDDEDKGSDLVRPITDPFTGETWMAVRAVRPQVSIIHAPCADRFGNVALDLEQCHGYAPDILIAQAARTVIVSVEQIVSEQAIAARQPETILRGANVTAVVEAPYGAHPCAWGARYAPDAEALRTYQENAASPGSFAQWLEAFVHGPSDHWAYLDRIGSRQIMAVARNRSDLT